MPAQLQDPVAHLREWLHKPAPQGRWLIGVSGLPGAGKSTLVQRWAQSLNAYMGTELVTALSMDGFHLTKAALARFPDPQAAFARRGAPWTFDPHALRAHLLALRAGESVAWPGFEHAVGDPVPGALQVGPQIRVALVEGLYLLHDQHGWDVANCFDEHWFVDVEMDTAMARLEDRHMAANQQSRAQARARLDGNDRLNADIAATARAKAHWLVSNPTPRAPAP
jgi:pantothenate kinase